MNCGAKVARQNGIAQTQCLENSAKTRHFTGLLPQNDI
jgi:hypothetical protein